VTVPEPVPEVDPSVCTDPSAPPPPSDDWNVPPLELEHPAFNATATTHVTIPASKRFMRFVLQDEE